MTNFWFCTLIPIYIDHPIVANIISEIQFQKLKKACFWGKVAGLVANF